MLIRWAFLPIGRLVLLIGILGLAAGCAGSMGPESVGKRVVDQRLAGSVVVKTGDSLYRISRRHGAPLRDLIMVNRISPPYRIYPGQRIRLPKARIHVVTRGETLVGVSRQYGVDIGLLSRANQIKPPYRLRKGQRLRLPSRNARTAGVLPSKSAIPRLAAKRPRSVALAKPPARSSAQFMWPIRGRVAIGFGPRGSGLHNDGINILARRGTKVRAAENGVVAYSGNEIRGFGNLILIKHSGGWMSAYAHNQDLLVRAGQKVRRGQAISRVGSTGSVTRPQLHFELRRGRRVVNPMRYLGPARQTISGLSRAFDRAVQLGPV